MTSALQLPTNSGAGLDIATTSIAGQHKFHRRNLTRADYLHVQASYVIGKAIVTEDEDCDFQHHMFKW
jgi:hypothetical protein